MTPNPTPSPEEEKILKIFDEHWPYPKTGKELSAQIKEFLIDAIRASRTDERKRIKRIVEEKIETAKTRKRVTPFQDTLFNYEVNVLTELLSESEK